MNQKHFLDNLELNFELMAEKIYLRNFNVKSNFWYTNGNTNTEGSKIDILTSCFGSHQMINEVSHILNSSSSCIDLIFASKLNLVTESSVHSSLQANCHHETTYEKFNLNVIYRPPNDRDMILQTSESIQRAICDWKESFFYVDVKKNTALIFSETVLNIIRKFIPHDIVTINGGDDLG